MTYPVTTLGLLPRTLRRPDSTFVTMNKRKNGRSVNCAQEEATSRRSINVSRLLDPHGRPGEHFKDALHAESLLCKLANLLPQWKRSTQHAYQGDRILSERVVLLLADQFPIFLYRVAGNPTPFPSSFVVGPSAQRCASRTAQQHWETQTLSYTSVPSGRQH